MIMYGLPPRCRRFILSRLNYWQKRIERGEGLRLAWHMQNTLCGVLFRAGFVLYYDDVKGKWRIER